MDNPTSPAGQSATLAALMARINELEQQLHTTTTTAASTVNNENHAFLPTTQTKPKLLEPPKFEGTRSAFRT